MWSQNMRHVEACFVILPAAFNCFLTGGTLFTIVISVMVAGKFAEKLKY
jgi:hypothetical protein